MLKRVLADTGLPAHALQLEVTEQAATLHSITQPLACFGLLSFGQVA